jgi:peroxiredoxin-like protein
MKPLPHHYEVIVTAEDQGPVELQSPGIAPLVSAPPLEFDGPGNLWSPETLLVAATADCFVLTFKAIAASAKLKWSKIICAVNGTLDRAEDGVRFTEIVLRPRLEIPAETDPDKAERLLQKAEKACLVGKSLKFEPTVRCDVLVEEFPCPGV